MTVDAKSPMICLHGFTGSPRNWSTMITRLQEFHEVTAVALTGHRGGPRPPAGVKVTPELLADDVERRMDELGLPTAHLVGNSLGGWLALELAARGRARSVVALSPALGWEYGPHVDAVFDRFRTGRRVYSLINPVKRFILKFRFARSQLLKFALYRPGQVTRSVAAEIISDNLACTAFDDILTTCAREFNIGPISCPVRLAWGQFDQLIPRDPFGKRYRSLVPEAEFTVIPDVGHVPMYDDPDRVAQEILQVSTRISRHAVEDARLDRWFEGRLPNGSVS